MSSMIRVWKFSLVGLAALMMIASYAARSDGQLVQSKSLDVEQMKSIRGSQICLGCNNQWNAYKCDDKNWCIGCTGAATEEGLSCSNVYYLDPHDMRTQTHAHIGEDRINWYPDEYPVDCIDRYHCVPGTAHHLRQCFGGDCTTLALAGYCAMCTQGPYITTTTLPNLDCWDCD